MGLSIELLSLVLLYNFPPKVYVVITASHFFSSQSKLVWFDEIKGGLN